MSVYPVFEPFLTIFDQFDLMGFSKKIDFRSAKFLRKLMSQFQENLRINGRTGGRTGRRTDRPCFIAPFQPRLGSNKFVIIDEPWMTGKIKNKIIKKYAFTNCT